MGTQVLGCFHFLVTVNNAEMSMGVHVYFFKLVFSFSSNKYPIVELVNHMVVLFLISEEPP